MVNAIPNRTFVVLGGAGAIGRIAARDLVSAHPQNRVVVADYNLAAARAVARQLRSRRATAAFADATRPQALVTLLRGRAVVVNCTQHDFNLRVMHAALTAGTHYVDLGGLFVWTRRQLRLDRRFRQAGLTAVIGMGCAPGTTNVMAQELARRLDRVESIAIRTGARDFRAWPDEFTFPYSAQTIVEELTLRPWVYRRGRFRTIAPRTGWEQITFPHPVGRQWVVCTRHSEVATLPVTLRDKGVRDCDFKVSFDRRFVREVVRRLHDGWTIKQFAALPTSRARPEDYEIARVIVTGRTPTGAARALGLDCHAPAKPEWHASAGDVDTGCPPSIVAQMIATGDIARRGVLPPEVAVPAELYLAELRRRGMTLKYFQPRR